MSSDEEQGDHDDGENEDTHDTIGDADEDTIRIMVSTDNHLGYAEGDAVRGNDSFAALEEVLFLAKHYGCDMVLLAGDLFHDNKPSRRTMHKAMTIFRQYCMGPDPISIQIISDQSQNFRQGLVNYENEFYSVHLPNHDDPAREGTELYAALDLLDCANLVNYIGRQDQINQIQISPVLIKKGSTHLALYGLGSMRDERLNRMWQGQKLTFLRPSQQEDSPEFFNLFALHQNRDAGRGTKNCVHETMIPEWMDLVCWGHEHECCIEPQESVVGTFRISQPGSSVATSLIAGEAARKKIGILDVRGQAFRLRPIPLTQVRSFVLGEVSLQDQRYLDPDDPKVEQKLNRFLQEQVDLLIHEATEKQEELLSSAEQDGNVLASMKESPLNNALQKPEEVLVRLKVEHAGFSALNNQRFGAKFIGQVANPTDILLFHRKKAAPTRSTKKVKSLDPIPPDDLEEMNIEDLIVGELEQSDRRLELFDEKNIADALEDYVQKQQAQAIPETVTNILGKQQKKLIKRGLDGSNPKENAENSETKRSMPQRAGGRRKREDVEADTQDFSEDESVEEPHEAPTKTSRKRVTSGKTTTRKAAQARQPSPDLLEDDEDNNSTQRSRRARPSRRGNSTAMSFSDDEAVEEPDEAPTKTTRKRVTSGRASTRKASQARQPSPDLLEDDDEDNATQRSSRARPTRRGNSTAMSFSDDETVEDTRSKTRQTQSRKPRQQRRKLSMSSDSDNNDMEVVEVDPPPPRKKAPTRRRVAQRSENNRASSRTSSQSTSRLSQSQLSFQPTSNKRPTRKGTRKVYNDSDVEDDKSPSGSFGLDDDWDKAKTDTLEL